MHQVDLEIRPSEVVGLLGPNGAGKTTTFYCILGLVAPDSGRVLLDGKDITSLPMYLRARRGISFLPQEASIFRKMTVEGNLMAILETVTGSRAKASKCNLCGGQPACVASCPTDAIQMVDMEKTGDWFAPWAERVHSSYLAAGQ